MANIHLKFVDDLTVAESLKLKKQLIANPDTDQPRPLEYRNRTEHILPDSESKVITLLENIQKYADDHKMKVNCDKSKVILFNTAKKWDFKPLLTFGESNYMNIVEDATVLGVQIQSNLKWNLNTDYICTRAYSRIWMLRRLKANGAGIIDLVDVYSKQVRCVLELAVAVWSPGLTVGQAAQIERVQKSACAVILGEQVDYKNALSKLNLKSLSERRKDLCLKFGRKCLKNEKFKQWFVERPNDLSNIQTRSNKSTFLPVNTRTNRFSKSPLPYLTSLLNEAEVK